MPTRVLVADDHLAIREGIRSLLAPDDELLVVGEAADGIQASRMALELKPDLILLDNSMPGKTGLEVARELKPLLPDASIVFLTLDPGIRDLALALGAVAHISKDTAPQETLRILRQVALQRAKAKPAELTTIERTLAEALVAEHLFTNEQMSRLVASRGPRETLAAALLRTGTIPDARAAQVLSRVSGKVLVTLAPYHDTGVARLARGRRSLIDPIDPTVTAQLAKRLCEQRQVVLVKLGRSEATLAMANPLDEQTPNDVSALLGNVPVTVVTASAGEIAAAIARGFVSAAPKIVPMPSGERTAARERSRRPLLLVAAALAALLLFLTGTAVILGPAASAVQARANLTIFQGNVDVRTGSGAYAPAGTGTVLRQGDTIRTRALANAALTFFDESIVVLESGTEVEIVELRAHSNGTIGAKLRQTSGSTWHVVSPQSTTSYAVTTPTSTASVTGTAFTVRVDPSGASTISTTEGTVEVRGVDGGANSTESVTAGFMTLVPSKGSAPSTAAAFAQSTVTFVLEDSRDAVIVDRAGRAAGISDGGLVRYIPGAMVNRVDASVVVTIPNTDGDRFASVVSPLDRTDQKVSVVAEARSSSGSVVGQVEDTRTVVDGVALGGVRVTTNAVVALSDDVARTLPAPVTASVPANNGFDIFVFLRREPSVAGNAGPAGTDGTEGPAGPPGPQGPAGADGATGATGPAGLAGPIGATGAQGLAGVSGVDGVAGVAGAAGPVGAQGPAGPAGSGSAGPAGPAGPAGADGVDGAAGPAGPQGPAGLDGAAGPAGPAGANGVDGAAGPQGPAGANGVDGAAGLAGPAGANGVDGAAGPAGPQGPAGLDGAAGPAGPAGANGVDGAAGPAGPQGPAGANGVDGAAGPAGPQGPAGANGSDGAAGPAGPQGPAGANGVDGAAGPAGPQGPAGLDGAAGPAGPAGANGVDGAAGPAGPQGPAGANGVDGAAGPAGPQGPAGANGVDGAAGPAGPQGPAGANGVDGAAGPQGIQGIQGPAGPAGNAIEDDGVAVTPNESTFDFAGGIAASSGGGKITINVDGTVVRTAGDQTIAGNKTFTGNTTLANTTVSNGSTVAVGDSSNTLTTQTAAQINTGDGLSSGQALAVNTGASTFTTGAGSGFFYGGTTDSYAGATTIKSTGDFSGTLVALTADRTTAGTVLGISAQNLTTGKAIDVSLGTLYSGSTDAQGTIGAVNVRAQSFTGNVFNVSASGAGLATSNLVNFQSTQLAGQVLNVNATWLTSGKAIAVTLGTQGTGIYVNTAAAYSGNLLQLQMNGADRLKVDQAGNTTIAGTLAVAGATTLSSTLDVTGNLAVNTDKFTVAAANGNTTVAGTLGVAGAGAFASSLGVAGDFAVNTDKFNVTAASGNTTVAGTLGVTGAGTFASTLDVTGNVAVNTNKFNVVAATGNTTIAGTLGVTGAGMFSTTLGVTGDFAVNTDKFNVAAATGNTTVAGTLGVTGTGTFSGALGVTGATTLSGGLTVNTNGNISQVGTGTFSTGTGQITLNGPLTVTQAALQGGVLVSNASGVVAAVAPGASGNVLTSNGTTFVSQAPSAGAVSVLDQQGATSAINVASTTEVTVYSVSIPGGSLGTDDMVRVHMHGTIVDSGGGARTRTIRVKYGATTLVGDVTPNIPLSGTARAFTLDVWLTGNGATNAQSVSARFNYSALAAATAGTGDFAAAELIVGQTMVGTSVIDSTAAQTFSVTMASSVNTGTQTFTRRYAITELVQ